MRESVEREFAVAADRAAVWERLMEVPTVASWLPILHSVAEVEPLARYKAVLEDKVGPFALRADLGIDVVAMDEPVQVAVQARGEDRQVRSRIMIDAAVQLTEEGPEQTRIRLSGSYEITGRVATLGAGVIRSKAVKLIDAFCTQAAEALTQAAY